MPKEGPSNKLLVRRSENKGVDHYGIFDMSNRIEHPHVDGRHPTVIHQTPPSIRLDWLQDAGVGHILGRITDEKHAIRRSMAALSNPAYDLFGHNCEQFTRYVATGVHESKQLQAFGFVAGLAALAIIAQGSD